MNLQLVRFAYLHDATLGWLTAGDVRVATLEDAWRPDPDGPGGQRREGGLLESCVPDGTYRLEPHSGAKFKHVWALVNHQLGVYHYPGEIPTGQPWGRSAILIHAGNSTDDVMGCIAVGLNHARVGSRPWVSESAKALAALRGVLGRAQIHQLTIRPIAGTAEVA